MVDSQQQSPIEFSWQALVWRLLLTAVLLAALAGSTLTVFSQNGNTPETNVLPTFDYETGAQLPR